MAAEEEFAYLNDVIPQDAWDLFHKGVAARRSEYNKEAVSFYDQAIELYPRFHQAWNNRGYALMALGRIDEAIESFEKAVKIKPDYHQALHSLSEAYWEKGDIDDLVKGMNYLVKALEIKPSYRLAKKDLKKFENRLQKAREIKEKHSEVMETIKSLTLRFKKLPATVNKDDFFTDLLTLQGAYSTEIKRYMSDSKEEALDMHNQTWFQRNKQEIVVITSSIITGLLGFITAVISRI